MNKTKLILITIFLICSVLGFVTQRHAIGCEAVVFSGFKQISANVYASSSVENPAQILEYISTGRKRVNATFGEMEAMPKIVIVGTIEEATSFGANSTATAFNTPLGACIVMSPKGHNVDVAAHELTHAEIADRVGWYTYLTQIPVWFNEGISLMVDHRKTFRLENISLDNGDVEKVKQLDTAVKFYTGDILGNYQSARVAVKQVEPKTLYEKLAQVRDGASFESQF